jgi:hypothetical protein
VPGLSPTRWIIVLFVILVAGTVVPFVLMNVGGGAGKLKTVTYTTTP